MSRMELFQYRKQSLVIQRVSERNVKMLKQVQIKVRNTLKIILAEKDIH